MWRCRFRRVGSGRFRRVPVCGGVGSGGRFRGFRRVLARVGEIPGAGFRRFQKVPARQP